MLFISVQQMLQDLKQPFHEGSTVPALEVELKVSMSESKGIISVSEQLGKLLVKYKKSNLFGRSYGLRGAKKEKEATDNH